MNFEQEPEQIGWFFLGRGGGSEMKWAVAQLRRRVRDAGPERVRCYLSADKGDCGVSVYSAAPIASPLKDPTYGVLIDS